ncbi:HD protein [Histoplasma capsulatum H143]|uniref:HD protein n=1 Tax=Ajellomyces capsulatus (strain H143) TaxID=544712 RepID=C6H5V3_AJECH|nr:HD protein [Histoplasma capsulatum H143]
MAESVVGDIPTYAGVPKEHKRKLEDSGFRYISSLLHFKPNLGQDIRDAWVEYDNGETKEAQWVREMDKFECLVQAHEYEQMTYGRGDFEEFQGLSSKIKSPKAKEWLALLQQERQAHFSKRRQRTAVIFAIDLKIRLLEEKINEGIAVGKKCSIVYGFPESMEELRGFEMKVNGDGSIEDVSDLVEKAVAEFVQHAEKGD